VNLVTPFCVGLTGGVGSGKSTVAERFARLKVPVIDTDVIAHALTGPNGAAMAAIVQMFGADIATETGALDRAVMRARVFFDPEARKRLEAILHPLILAQVAHQQLTNAWAPYVLLVVPLLVENLPSYRPMLQRILLVDCDESQQLERTAARPGLDLEQAKAILGAQASQAVRLAIADDVINNRADLSYLDEQVKCLHSMYLGMSAK
jgi:dephospho-CoA kinase